MVILTEFISSSTTHRWKNPLSRTNRQRRRRFRQRAMRPTTRARRRMGTRRGSQGARGVATPQVNERQLYIFSVGSIVESTDTLCGWKQFIHGWKQFICGWKQFIRGWQQFIRGWKARSLSCCSTPGSPIWWWQLAYCNPRGEGGCNLTHGFDSLFYWFYLAAILFFFFNQCPARARWLQKFLLERWTETLPMGNFEASVHLSN